MPEPGPVFGGCGAHRLHALIRKMFKLPSPHFCLLIFKRYVDAMKTVNHLHYKTYPKAKVRYDGSVCKMLAAQVGSEFRSL